MNSNDFTGWYPCLGVGPGDVRTLVAMTPGGVVVPAGIPGAPVLGVLLAVETHQAQTWARVQRAGQAMVRTDGTATRGDLVQLEMGGVVGVWTAGASLVGQALGVETPEGLQSIYLQADLSVGGGGGVSGDPNAVAYFDPTGASLIDDPALTAAPLDPQQRPQLLDCRINGTEGPVWRQGGWSADGDPVDQPSNGVVLYGPSVNGGLNAAEGAYGRMKSDRFGLFTILPGGPPAGYYQWRMDPTELYARRDDAAATRTFEVQRSTGQVQVRGNVQPYTDNTGTLGAGGQRWNQCHSFEVYTRTVDTDAAVQLHVANTNATSLDVGNTSGPFQVFINQGGFALHGSNAGIQYASTTANRAQLRVNVYGAHTGVPGLTAFKSRGASIGSLAAVADGDCLLRTTAIGVAGDNASIPLAGYLSFYVPTGGIVAGQGWVSTRFAVEVTPLNGPTNNHRECFGVTSEGALQMRETPGALGGPLAAGIGGTGAGGTVAIANTAVNTATRVTLTIQPGGPAATGVLEVASITPGVGFDVRSSSAQVGVLFYWQLWEKL